MTMLRLQISALLLGVAAIAAAGCGDSAAVVPDAQDIDAPPIPTPPKLTISPATSAFGTGTVGVTSAGATFTITNTGQASSGVLAASLSNNADFLIQSNTCTILAGGANCQVVAAFKPASSGAKTSVLQVASAEAQVGVTATLDGNGVVIGSLTIAASANALGTVVVGETGAQVATFTVTNTGSSSIGPVTVAPTAAAPDFHKSHRPCHRQNPSPDLLQRAILTSHNPAAC